MLPIMKKRISTDEKFIKNFKGINVRDNHSFGELIDGINTSSDMYPSLGIRKQRLIRNVDGGTVNGIGDYDGLIYTHYSDGKIFLNYHDTDYEFTGYTSADLNLRREFASLADSIMIIPDNIIFTPSAGIFRTVCVNQDGKRESALEKFSVETRGGVSLNDDGEVYIGTLSHNSINCRNYTYRHNQHNCEFYYFAFDPVLKSGDVITVKMEVTSDEIPDELYHNYRKKMENGVILKIKEVQTVKHTVASGDISESIKLIFDDYAVDVCGASDVVFSNIVVERNMPDVKHICSFNNRIWGVTETELCCSKLGDASEWNDFSTDIYGVMPYASFSTPASGEGKFTAVKSFGNYIYAFKENAVYKLYGDSPDEFVLKTQEINGVSESMEPTLSKSGDSLIYASHNGIYMFDESSSYKISECLRDDMIYISAAGDAEKYYILCTVGETRYVYVYDVKLKQWHCEDSPDDAVAVIKAGRFVILMTEKELIYLNSFAGQRERFSPSWRFRLKFDEKLAEKNGIGKVSVRYSLGDDAFFNVRASYPDGCEGALCGARHDETVEGGNCIYIPIRRSNGFYLEFKGKGEFSLKSLKIQYYRGSEI